MSANAQSGDDYDERLVRIPNELKERDQWLLWDTDSDRKQPHWDGSYSISWSNPDDWRSFEEAIECAAKRESWYIGYVCAVENDSYDGGEYGVIDLDGVVNEDGSLADWLPPLDRFEEEMTFMEYSGSGTGIHIPFRAEVPSWWRDGQLGDHEGIDVLANKFCAFTGDTLDSSGTTIADIDPTPWLLEAYNAIHGEYPEIIRDGPSNNDQSGNSSNEEWLTDDLVEDALNHLNPDVGYSEWRDIAFAVHDYDSGPTGQALFDDWSSDGSKYDKSAKRQVERFWKQTDRGSGITVATLIHIARRAGWVPDIAPSSPSKGEDSDDGDETGLLDSSIEEGNGGYGKVEYGRDGEPKWEQITTFTLEVNAFLDERDSDEFLIDLTVVPASNAEGSFDVAIEPTVFNDVQKFKNEVCIGRTTTFSGNYDDLNALRIHIGQRDAPRRTGTRKIGMHGDELVTPDGVFGPDWDLDEPTHRYIHTGSPADTKWKLGEDGDYDPETVARILELLPQTRDTDRWFPAIGWYYAVSLAPWIREWAGQLPMLMASGDTGSGKTSALGQLYKMMGMDGAPGSAQDTKFALIRALSSTTNIPTWLDEYKPSDMSSYQKDQMQDLLRKATRGGDEARGNADQTVTTYRIISPVVLSGEQELQGAAEERRAIRTQFRKVVTTEGTETAQAWAKLSGGSYEDAQGVHYCEGYDPHEHAKAIHQYALNLDKDEAHELWQESRRHIHGLLSNAGIAGVGDLEQQALQMIKFGMVLYQHFGSTVNANLKGIITNDDIDSAIIYIAGKMGTQNRTSHVDEFLGLMAAAIEDGELIVGHDFKIVHRGKDNEELRIKMAKAHHAVSKYVRDHGLDGYDLLNKANDYKSRMADLAEEDDSYVVDIGVFTKGLNRCVAIDTHRMEEQVDGFVRDSIVY